MKTTEPKTTSALSDELHGEAKIVSGAIKKEVGKAVGNTKLENRGVREERAGNVEKKIGEIKKVFSD